jgi:hypothetical protein
MKSLFFFGVVSGRELRSVYLMMRVLMPWESAFFQLFISHKFATEKAKILVVFDR